MTGSCVPDCPEYLAEPWMPFDEAMLMYTSFIPDDFEPHLDVTVAALPSDVALADAPAGGMLVPATADAVTALLDGWLAQAWQGVASLGLRDSRWFERKALDAAAQARLSGHPAPVPTEPPLEPPPDATAVMELDEHITAVMDEFNAAHDEYPDQRDDFDD